MQLRDEYPSGLGGPTMALQKSTSWDTLKLSRKYTTPEMAIQDFPAFQESISSSVTGRLAKELGRDPFWTLSNDQSSVSFGTSRPVVIPIRLAFPTKLGWESLDTNSGLAHASIRVAGVLPIL